MCGGRSVRIFPFWSWRPPSTHHRRRALDGAEDGHVGTAAAFDRPQRGTNFFVRRFLLITQERGGGHDPAVDAIGALRDLLFDIRGLQRMRMLGRAEASERHDSLVADFRDGPPAGANRLAVEMHRAGTALAQPTAEMRIVETDFVAQHVEQRRIWIALDCVVVAVDVERVFLGHCDSASMCAATSQIGPAICRCVPMPPHRLTATVFLNRLVVNTAGPMPIAD